MIYYFYIKTFGCQMNVFDSIKINLILKKSGFINTLNFKKINYLVINTCSVRKTSQNKIFNFINNLYKIKKNFFLILYGCSSNIFYNYFLKKKYINIIVGTNDLDRIPLLIKFYNIYKIKQISVNFYLNKNYNYYFLNYSNKYIVISQGCNKNCSFCIIPYTRGFEFSINISAVLLYIYKNNNNSIILLGQNVSSYKYFLNNKIIYFFELLNYINLFYNINFYSYLSCHIKDFNKNLIFNHNFNKKIKKFLHIPVQSFSDKILINMKRNYNIRFIKKVFLSFFSILNFNFIYTDIIICYYKEKNIEFNKNIIFIEKFLLDKSYLFFFNKRPFTKNFYLNFKYNDLIKYYRVKKIFKKFRNNIIYLNNFIKKKFLVLYVDNCILELNFIFSSYFYNRNNKFKLKFFDINSFNFYLKYKIYNFFINE